MVKLKRKNNIKSVAIVILLVSSLILSFFNVNLNIKVSDLENIENVFEILTNIEFAEDQNIETKIETSDGEIEVISAPVVDSVDSLNVECPENEECGLGKYVYAPTETPTAFKDYTIGKCWDTDNYPEGAKAQCWDLGDLFWQNYAGRNLSTCDTGMAKGIWNCKEYNAGNQFELITDSLKLQLGDWIIFGSGQYGHIGMAMGGYNNGYIALLGENQGGKACDYGGSSANIINISLNSFIGAFRPKSYIKPEPKPEPIPISGCVRWHVLRGDTMSKIMLECEGTIKYGEPMNEYAKTWYSLVYKPGQSVYDGWNSSTGVGLYAGDDIEHRLK